VIAQPGVGKLNTFFGLNSLLAIFNMGFVAKPLNLLCYTY